MRYTEFGYSDELAEILMNDEEMLAFLKCAIDTNSAEHVMKAVQTINHARDHREIVIRNLGRDLPE